VAREALAAVDRPGRAPAGGPNSRVVEKVRVAVTLLWNPGNSLIGWQGDLQHYPGREFFAVFPNAATA